MSELNPCPFCKEQERLFVQSSIGDAYWGKCLECGAEGPIAKTEQEAIDTWNQRAERTCENTNAKKPYTIFFRCSACGYPKTDEIDAQMLVEEINYCPNCGARVVKKVE